MLKSVTINNFLYAFIIISLKCDLHTFILYFIEEQSRLNLVDPHKM